MTRAQECFPHEHLWQVAVAWLHQSQRGRTDGVNHRYAAGIQLRHEVLQLPLIHVGVVRYVVFSILYADDSRPTQG
jgi:hypothetical protein